jgi:uncharacterized integral membrane protein
MPRWLFWAVAVLLLAPTGLFAIDNSHLVPVYLWPFFESFSFPLSGVLYAALLLGFGIGAFVHWLHDKPKRQRLRDLADQNGDLLRQVAELKRDQAAARAKPVTSGGATDLAATAGR